MISRKIIALFVSLIVVLGAIFGIFSVRYQRTMLMREFDERAKVLVNGLAAGIGYQVFVEDREALARTVKSVLGQKDVVFCEIRGKNGALLFSGGARKGRVLKEFKAPIGMRRNVPQGEELIVGFEKEATELVGEAVLVLSLSDLLDKVNETRVNIVIMVVFGIMVSALFISIFVRMVLSEPIHRLTQGIEKIAGGDLDYKVAVTGRDEIGQLASNFNNMTDALKRTTVSRDSLMREVAERKKAQEQLKSAYEKLKQAQAQLVQSAKMASVGLLAGGVAHEINNPLTGVLNNVQLVRMMAEAKSDFSMEDFRGLLAVIEESAQRCTKITRSLLDFSRASKGVLAEVSLNDIAEKVSILIEHELGLQNVAVRKELEAGLPSISGDPQLLQQAVFDLITNAKWAIRRKTERGGTIVISTRSVPERGGVSISVEDDGIGIPAENLGKIFEPFFTTKEVGEGTGLGLSIVYNIVKEHRGIVDVQSEPGKGTVFRLTFPAAKRTA